MKRLKIEHISDVTGRNNRIKARSRKFSIALGNGYKGYFPNRREAEKFLGETNNFINFRLLELNTIYGEFLLETRNVWPLWRNNHKKKKLPLIHMEQQCNREAEAIADRMNHILRYHGVDAAFLIFHDLDKICNWLTEGIGIIKKLHASRNNQMAVYKMESLLQRVSRHQFQLDNYGHLELNDYVIESIDWKAMKIVV